MICFLSNLCAALHVCRWLCPVLVSLIWTLMFYQPLLFSSSSLHNDRKQTNKKHPSLESAICECSAVTVMCWLYTQRKGEKRHANNTTHSVPHFFKQPAANKSTALTCLLHEWWGQNSSQLHRVSKGHQWSGRRKTRPTISTSKLRQKRRFCFAATVTLLLPLFRGRWWCFVVRCF